MNVKVPALNARMLPTGPTTYISVSLCTFSFFLYFTITLNLVNYNNDQYFTYRCNLSTENKPDTGFEQHNSDRHANNNVGIVFSSVVIRCILSNAFISSSNTCTYTRKMLVQCSAMQKINVLNPMQKLVHGQHSLCFKSIVYLSQIT